MVQQATPPTESDVTSTLGDLAADAPLVEQEESPVDLPEGEQPIVVDEPEATDTPADGAAQAEQEDTAQAEETEELARSVAATLTREEHEAELAKVRSGLDKRYSEAEKRIAAMEEAAAERDRQYQQQLSQQQFEAQVQAYQRQVAEKYVDAGHTQEDAERLARQDTETAKQAYPIYLENERLKAELASKTTSAESVARRQAATELAQEHGVSNDDMELLLSARDAESMTALAQRLGSYNSRQKAQAEARRAEVPAGANTDLDNADGTSGGMTDMQRWVAYGNGEIDMPLDEAVKLQRKLGFA